MKRIAIRTLKCFVFTGVFSLLSASAFAGSSEAPDSLRTKTVNGQKVRLHKVLPKETWTGVARQYDLDITVLQRANPGVDELKIGQIINVPLSGKGQTAALADDGATGKVDSPQKDTPQTDVSPKSAAGPRQIHTVERGETLFSIATKYNLTVDELKEMNKLSSNNIALGRKLIVTLNSAPEPITTSSPVKEIPAETNAEVKSDAKVEPKTETKSETKSSQATTSTPVTKSRSSAKTDPSALPKAYTNPGASRTKKREKDEKTGVDVDKFEEVGLVAWFGSDTDMNPNKFYALHRLAPIGTIIKLTNRMNNNSVFVKVVGVLPDTGDNENLICKITQAAAQRIGALDQRFTAELSYGVTIGLVDSGE